MNSNPKPVTAPSAAPAPLDYGIEPGLDEPLAAPPVALGATAARGVMWAASVTILNRVVSIVAQLVIAAVLLPGDFGIFAKALFVSGLLSQVLSPAVDQFLISRAREYGRFAAAAFWVSLVCGCLSLLLHVAAAPLIAAAQRNQSILYVLPLMGVAALLSVCGTSLAARLSIQLRFRLIAVVALVGAVVTHSLTVAAALAGWGVYALVAPPIVTGAATLAFYLFVIHVPGLARPSFALWPEILMSSTRLMGVRVMQSTVAQGAYFVLGLFASDAVVGIYYFAFNLADQVARLLGVSVANVLTPSLAQINDDPTRTRLAVMKASQLLSVGVTPLSVCQILFASTAIYAFFGEKWMAAVPLIQIMSLAAIVNVPGWPTGSLMTAAGRFGELLKLWIVNVVLFTAFIVSGALIGRAVGASPDRGAAIGTAIGSTVFYAVATAIGVTIALRSRADMALVLRTPIRPLLIALLASVPAIGVLALIPTNGRVQALAELAAGGVTFLGVYGLALRFLAPDLWTGSAERLHRRRAPAAEANDERVART